MGADGRGTPADDREASPDAPGDPADPPEWRHETAHLGDVSLHYVRVDPGAVDADPRTRGRGPDDGDRPGKPPLAVLLHGFPEFWYAWRNQLTPLAAAGYRVVAPDLRGYNRSSAPRGVSNYGPDRLVADVRGLVESLGYARTTLVGHDWGGLVGWETALREPALLDRLVVFNAPHPDLYRQAAKRSPRQLLRSWYAVAAQVPWLPERLLRAGDFAAVEAMLADTVRPDAFTDADVRRYKRALATEGTLTAACNYYRAQLRAFLRAEARGLVGRDRDPTVRVPTTVGWGVHDRALGPALLDGLDAVVPELRVERLETSHWVPADAPERVTALIQGD